LVQFVASLLTRMATTTPLLSVAESRRVTAGFVVNGEPPLIRIVPEGAVTSVMILLLAAVAPNEPVTVSVAVNAPRFV